jgi:hypothetical protein
MEELMTVRLAFTCTHRLQNVQYFVLERAAKDLPIFLLDEESKRKKKRTTRVATLYCL